MGTTRGQLRSIVRAEALIISLFGALEGLLLGMIFGWAIVAVLRSRGVTTLVLPAGQLFAMAGFAGLAGIVAAIAPAAAPPASTSSAPSPPSSPGSTR